MLLQVQNGVERVLCYGSYTLSPEQKRYCTTRKELLAVVRFTRQFRHYLLGRSFTIRTDHSSLTWLLHFKEPQGQIARWLEELSQYDMKIVHRPGKNHGNADALSRIAPELDPCSDYHAGSVLADLPCGGCKYCTRIHESGRKFEESVDDVVGLNSRACSLNLPDEEFKIFLEADVSEGSDSDLEEDLHHTSIVFENTPGSVKEVSITSSNSTTWDLATEKVKQCQASDSDLEFLISWLTQQEEPREGELFIASPAAKFYWINRTSFVMSQELIWQKNPKTRDLWLLVPVFKGRGAVFLS